MKVETLSRETSPSTTEGAKLLLMDEIIEFFTPFFFEEIEDKQKKLEICKSDYSKLRNAVRDNSSILKEIDAELKKEKLISQILDEIQYLNQYDILYGNNKTIVIDMISMLYKTDTSRLENILDKLQRMSKKNISKVRQ